MWAFIFGFAFIAVAAGFLYLTSRVYRLLPKSCFAPLLGSDNRIQLFISICAVFIVTLSSAVLFGIVNAAIVIIHITVFWLLSDLLFYVVKKLSGARLIRLSSCVAVVTAFVYLSVGYALCNNVSVTRYTVYTDKHIGTLRIVMFADSHLGATFSGAELNGYVKRMQSYNPDMVVIAGDFVDDDTSKKDMTDGCKALGKLKTTYGVYYAYGNHDNGYYDSSLRGYTGDDLVAELKKNGVTVLQDEVADLGGFYVVGRADASHRDRADISDLVEGTDRNKLSIVINHQPNDYAAESKANVDLVLSGHTHGGQMVPIGLVMNIFGLNDRVYGSEKRNNTSFIVTSGIADWAFKFKIGCFSEFVVVDIVGR